MRSVIRTIRACVEARRRHYREDGREIAANNMRTLRSVTLLTVCLLAVFLLFSLAGAIARRGKVKPA